MLNNDFNVYGNFRLLFWLDKANMNMRQIILCRNGIAGCFFYLLFACNMRFFLRNIRLHFFLCVRMNKMSAFSIVHIMFALAIEMCASFRFGPITSLYQFEQLLKSCNQYIVLCSFFYYEQPNKQKFLLFVIYEFDFIWVYFGWKYTCQLISS